MKRAIGFRPSPYPSTKIFIHNVHSTIRRKYQTILHTQPQIPPSAIHYQINKLKTATNCSRGLYSRLVFWGTKHPLILATAFGTLKSVIADWIAQCGIEQRDWDTFNWSRFTLFALYGVFYVGMVQYGIYNKLYPLLFNGMKKGFLRTSCNTMVDMMIHSQLIYFPTFYIFKGFVYGQSVSMDIVRQQLHQYFAINFKEDMIDLYKLWLPAMFVTFAVMPLQLRVPWISTVGILWAVLLSLKRGDADAPAQPITSGSESSDGMFEYTINELNDLTKPTLIGQAQA